MKHGWQWLPFYLGAILGALVCVSLVAVSLDLPAPAVARACIVTHTHYVEQINIADLTTRTAYIENQCGDVLGIAGPTASGQVILSYRLPMQE